jgi:hypothetical protein
MRPATLGAAVASPAARPAHSVRSPLVAWLGATAPPSLVLAAVLAAVVPIWNPVWYQDDQLPTLFRTFHTDLAHHQGVLYPRLAPELGFGYGRLLHQFYPPLGVELGAWLHTLGLGFVDAARATFSLCLLASALGMYAYARSVLGGPWPAALAAIGYVWAPYVLLDAHKGGVLGESVALALMPWSLLALDRLVRGGGWLAFGGAAGSLALIVLGHNITALFFMGLACLYALLLATGEGRERPEGAAGRAVRDLARAGGAVALALALAAIYWLPALTELPYSRVADQRTGEFTVTRYLSGPSGLLQPSLVFDYYVEAIPRYGLTAAVLTLGAAALALLAILRRPRSMAEVLARLRRSGPDRAVVVACVLCFVVVLLLQVRPSAIVWETVPLISYVQFPQRLFVFGAFAGAIVLGTVPWAVGALTHRRSASVATGASIAILLGLTSLPGIYWTWPVAGSHVVDDADVGIGTPAERRLAERRAFDDYFPIWVREDAGQITRPPTPNGAEAYAAAGSGPAPRLDLRERGALQAVVEAEAETAGTVVLHQFYFPGWQAEANGNPLTVGPSGPLGLVTVTVPAGRQLVRVWFGETPTRLAATGISVVALGSLLVVLARGLGPWRTLAGLAAVLLVVAGPRLLHDRLDPVERPALRVVNAEPTPTARVLALELADRPLRPGEVVPVGLVWQSLAYTPRDLQTGVRLLTADGSRMVAERWGRPNRERTPTGKWIVGELVPDMLLLRVPTGAPAGRYRLQAGLRDPDARDRAPLGLAEIGEVEVR